MFFSSQKYTFFSLYASHSPNIFIRERGGFICLCKRINLEMMLFLRTFASSLKVGSINQLRVV